jgi:cytochrome b561
VAIALHWAIAGLIAFQFAAAWTMTSKGTDQFTAFQLYQIHKTVGLLVLLLSVLRLAWRLFRRPPELPRGMAHWEIAAARISHVAFYIFMVAVPVLGWLMVSASPVGLPTLIYGTSAVVPHAPLPHEAELADFLKSAHRLLAYSMLALLVLHIAGALKHHFVAHDDVLRRMLPTFPSQREQR